MGTLCYFHGTLHDMDPFRDYGV